MKLGDYTFDRLPTAIDGIIRPEKRTAEVETYGGTAFFSWGVSIAGTHRLLTWRAMPVSMFNDIDSLYQNDTTVTWEPGDGSGKTYDVELTRLSGTYLIHFADEDTSDGGKWYQNVTLDLLILGETT